MTRKIGCLAWHDGHGNPFIQYAEVAPRATVRKEGFRGNSPITPLSAIIAISLQVAVELWFFRVKKEKNLYICMHYFRGRQLKTAAPIKVLAVM